MNLSDASLVKSALAAERWAEEALYRRHARSVFGLVASMLRDQQDAEDVVQDTFITALSELKHLQNPEAFRPWLMRIAVRKVHRLFRRRKLRRLMGMERSAGEEFSEFQPKAECPPDVAATLQELSRHVSTLSDNVRMCWTLRYVEGWPLEDVAQACNCSLATAKRRIAKAMSHIRAHMVLDIDVGENE